MPAPVKVLLAFSVSIMLFPVLLGQGLIHPGEALRWGATAGGIVGTVATEAIFGLILGFVAKLVFDSIAFGGNLTGHFMGFSMANTYDPHMESQTMVVAEIQMTIAMLAFLALDGHHLMLRAALGSYQIVGLGALKNGVSADVSKMLITLTSDVVKAGVQLSAPVAVSIFAVNVAFGVLAKAMPQLNILVLSLAATALVGLSVMFLTVPEFQGLASNVLGKIGESMVAMMRVVASG